MPGKQCMKVSRRGQRSRPRYPEGIKELTLSNHKGFISGETHGEKNGCQGSEKQEIGNQD